jgi:DNA-binding XRE family transcriptional regulator
VKVKFKATPDGEVAILPRKEYERLKAFEQEAQEDAGTARLIARAKKDIAGGTPVLPRGIVDRLANAENPIRVLRQFREQTQAELSAGVGITQNYLSDLETGKRKGPLELHQKIARFLGVPLDLLRRPQCQPRKPIQPDLPNANMSSPTSSVGAASADGT